MRIAVIALTVLLLAYFVFRHGDFINEILVIALLVFQVISLLKFIEKQMGISPSANTEADIMATNQSGLSSEKFQYLKTIVQHAAVGLITFDQKGQIQIMNIAARKLFRMQEVKNIEELSILSQHLVDSLKNLKTGGRDLIRVEFNGEETYLSVYAIELSLKNKTFKLVSIQNIKTELEEMEMDAWQNLIRVLTHEIMNSVTPISSLASTADQEVMHCLDNSNEICEIKEEDLREIHLAIQTIQRRSEGLIKFVSDFRNLTRIPVPTLQQIKATDLIEHVVVLLKKELEEHGVNIQSKITPENFELHIDPELIQQVLINLIKNAIQAFDPEQKERSIRIIAQETRQAATIEIEDNGAGIDDEAIKKVFIPFFTTKKSGSGIGLSLSRQIMRQHNGYINVTSQIDEGTTFILTFRKGKS